ncbi:MAG: 4'-phosphopantetheinyl transferase family protein, partial [Solirubrobacteraceae bacterium]
APGGKPILPGEPLQFNLSHSGSVALVAVSLGLPVGIDVQEAHRATATPWFARRICTPREHQRVGRLADPEALLRLWVRKEAVIKARGEGSSIAAGEIDVLEDHVAGGWLCRDLPRPAPGYRAAVATRQAPGVSVVIRGSLARPGSGDEPLERCVSLEADPRQ